MKKPNKSGIQGAQQPAYHGPMQAIANSNFKNCVSVKSVRPKKKG